MKTHLNSTEQRWPLLIVVLGCLLLTAGCQQFNSPVENSESELTIEGLNINVKYAESYDQTVTTFSRIWPQGISAGLGKGKASTGGELMVDFERTHEIIAFDEEGYMSSVSEFLEGDGEMNMPEEVYNRLKTTMPARSNDFDPVVRTEMKDGKTLMFGKSGELKFEQEYDPEVFRITQAELDSLEAWYERSNNTDQSVQKNLLSLNKQGMDYERVGEFHVSYTIEAGNEEQQKGISSYHYTDDLRTGLTAQLVILRTDGKYDSIVRSRYQKVSGIPVLSSSVRYTYGLVNEKWDIAYREKTTRENIKVTRN